MTETAQQSDPFSDAPNPDRAALARVGKLVRARLANDPGVYRFPCDQAEIYAVTDFLSTGECQRLIARIDEVARPSTLYNLGHGEQYRTSYSGDVDRNDAFIRMIERKIDDLLGIDGDFGETVQGQRYAPGQEFMAHYDWFFTRSDYWQSEKDRGGQRSWTAMVFLGEVEEGGNTDFTRIGISIPPQRGLLLLWNNTLPDGSPNVETLHAGTPVVRGVKYIITKWYRTRRWG